MNKTTLYTSKPLDDSNVIQYLTAEYSLSESPRVVESKIIDNFPYLLQNDYGKALDCTITSMTACIAYYTKSNKYSEIYSNVEKIAENYLYDGDSRGTFSTAIKFVYDKAFEKYGIKRKSSYRLFKNIGYDKNLIRKAIDSNTPILLSLSKDGRNYYKNHTITIIGYKEIGNNFMLVVSDNWSKTQRYVDYKLLNEISSINY